MRFMAIALVPFALAACGGSDDSADTTVATSVTTDAVEGGDTTTVAPDSDDTSAPAVVETEQVSARGVVLASVLLVEGDVEQAVADGRVTPAEVDAAVAAIESGTLEAWVALAGD